MESFALTAAMTMPLLLLQKPHRSSKTKDHVACLKRRRTVWKSGDIDALVRECRAIQASLRVSGNARVKASTEDSVIRGFTKLMLLGNVRGALRVLSQAPPPPPPRRNTPAASSAWRQRRAKIGAGYPQGQAPTVTCRSVRRRSRRRGRH